MKRLAWTGDRDVRGGALARRALFDRGTLVLVYRDALGFVEGAAIRKVALPEEVRYWTSTSNGLVGITDEGILYHVRDNEVVPLSAPANFGKRHWPAIGWDPERDRVVIAGGNRGGRSMVASGFAIENGNDLRSIRKGPKEWMGAFAWYPPAHALVFAGGAGSVTTAKCKATHELVDGTWRSFPTTFAVHSGLYPDVCATDSKAATVVLVLWGGLTRVEPIVRCYAGEGRWRDLGALPVPNHGQTEDETFRSSMALAYDAEQRRIVFARFVDGASATTIGHCDIAALLNGA